MIYCQRSRIAALNKTMNHWTSVPCVQPQPQQSCNYKLWKLEEISTLAWPSVDSIRAKTDWRKSGQADVFANANKYFLSKYPSYKPEDNFGTSIVKVYACVSVHTYSRYSYNILLLYIVIIRQNHLDRVIVMFSIIWICCIHFVLNDIR